MKSAPEETSETDLARAKDSTDHRRSMRQMDWWIRWYDTHESWFLRELRWRDQGRIS